MKTYYILGRVIVERKTNRSEYEILDAQALSDFLYGEPTDDLTELVFSPDDVPEEPGVYVLLYHAFMYPEKNYYGEVEMQYELEWHLCEKLSDQDAKLIFASYM